jgi:hypothetical protein
MGHTDFSCAAADFFFLGSTAFASTGFRSAGFASTAFASILFDSTSAAKGYSDLMMVLSTRLQASTGSFGKLLAVPPYH